MSMSKFATVADYYAHIEQVNAELLEALEELYSTVIAMDYRRADIPTIGKARAAIAKARGGV